MRSRFPKRLLSLPCPPCHLCSPVDERLGYLCLLSIVSNAALNVLCTSSRRDMYFHLPGSYPQEWDCWVTHSNCSAFQKQSSCTISLQYIAGTMTLCLSQCLCSVPFMCVVTNFHTMCISLFYNDCPFGTCEACAVEMKSQIPLSGIPLAEVHTRVVPGTGVGREGVRENGALWSTTAAILQGPGSLLLLLALAFLSTALSMW